MVAAAREPEEEAAAAAKEPEEEAAEEAAPEAAPDPGSPSWLAQQERVDRP